MSIPYYHVDSFTGEVFAGNPAGVCILSAFPDDETMRKIAAENRHSETAFVVPRTDDFDLRWFTPKIEDDLCGHATLASAYVLALRNHASWPIRFHTVSGVLTVDRNEEGFELDFPARPPEPCDTPAGLLQALGVENALVMRSRDYMVVVDHAEKVKALSPNMPALAKIDVGIGGTTVTARGQNGADYVCRFFSPTAGIDEDPATGSIQCTLAPYWALRLRKTNLRAEQLSARGGSMQCRVAGTRVKISGKARLYLEGRIDL